MRPLLLLMALVSAAATGVVHAQWIWRDAAGQVHASDLPPPRSVADKDVLQRPHASSAARAAAPSPAESASSPPAAEAAASAADRSPRVDPELEARRKAAEQEKLARELQDAQRVAAQRSDNCERARAHLRQLDSGMRLARVNDKGERIIIDDKERAAEAQRARQVIASDCR